MPRKHLQTTTVLHMWLEFWNSKQFVSFLTWKKIWNTLAVNFLECQRERSDDQNGYWIVGLEWQSVLQKLLASSSLGSSRGDFCSQSGWGSTSKLLILSPNFGSDASHCHFIGPRSRTLLRPFLRTGRRFSFCLEFHYCMSNSIF